MSLRQPESPRRTLSDARIPTELVELLEELYPPKCMCIGESLERHMHYAGTVYLVQQLRYFHDERQDMDMLIYPSGR